MNTCSSSCIIRGETVQEVGVLSASGEFIIEKNAYVDDLLEEECRAAFNKGVEKGEKIGYEKSREEIKIFIDLLQTMARKILEYKHRLLDQLKPEVIEFAMTVCERLIRKELSQPEALVNLIHSLLTATKNSLKSDAIDIIVAPEDLSMLESHLSSFARLSNGVEGLTFRKDPLMRRGDVRLETKAGLLNYDLARELADLQTLVLQR